MADVWQRGDAYERFMGRWSRHVAPRFLDWLAMPDALRWADVGCGSGALTSSILSRASPVSVLAVDPAPGQVQEAARRIADPRADFAVTGAEGLSAGTLDVVVSGLVLNFVEDPVADVAAMARAAPGGTVAAYVWDYAEGMQLLRRFWDVASALDPAAKALHEGHRFPSADLAALLEIWGEAGLTQIQTTAITVPTIFRDEADFWDPFLGGQGPAPGYVASLDPEARDDLRAELLDRLPVAADGSIMLTARAWAVSGMAS